MKVNLNLNQPNAQQNYPSFKMNIKSLVPDLNATIGSTAAKDMVKKFNSFGADTVHLYCEEYPRTKHSPFRYKLSAINPEAGLNEVLIKESTSFSSIIKYLKRFSKEDADKVLQETMKNNP
ncbi:TPA: hypothetical protein CPT81_08000 [Candidatus Gastranaerophilales bacterium HUM_20]|nr:unknown [Clostridium sp. CAG:729]DAB19695.1 MAG TPA: hypothetical protein CPT81_08000 [Candidatus Gastranaerophilales bacterium HUM_20]